jgi:hypothetical protein
MLSEYAGSAAPAKPAVALTFTVVRGLVEKGLLSIAGGYRNRFSKLIPEKEVRRFAGSHVAVSALARRLKLSGWSFARHLRRSGTPLLAVPISDEGKEDSLFLSKNVAARLSSSARL